MSWKTEKWTAIPPPQRGFNFETHSDRLLSLNPSSLACRDILVVAVDNSYLMREVRPSARPRRISYGGWIYRWKNVHRIRILYKGCVKVQSGITQPLLESSHKANNWRRVQSAKIQGQLKVRQWRRQHFYFCTTVGTHILLWSHFFPKCVPNVSRNNYPIITR